MNKYELQFLNDDDSNSYKINKSDFIIIPAPLEKTTSYLFGTCHGPDAILKSSIQLEHYDIESDSIPLEKGIFTIKPLIFNNDSENNINLIKNCVLSVLKLNSIPIMLGGEHSVTLGAILALLEFYKNKPISILQFDAHGDLRFSYDGTMYSHACVMRQCLEKSDLLKLTQIGIRAICKEEKVYMDHNPHNISTFFAHNKQNWVIDDILSSLHDEVYITFDVDVLDPSIMSATGTPEPGGLLYNESIKILKKVCTKKNIIGFDFVELSPREDSEYCDFTVAKLIYKIVSFINNKI